MSLGSTTFSHKQLINTDSFYDSTAKYTLQVNTGDIFKEMLQSKYVRILIISRINDLVFSEAGTDYRGVLFCFNLEFLNCGAISNRSPFKIITTNNFHWLQISYTHNGHFFSTAEENPGSIQPIILHWKTNAELWSNIVILKNKQTSHKNKQTNHKRETKTPCNQLNKQGSDFYKSIGASK